MLCPDPSFRFHTRGSEFRVWMYAVLISSCRAFFASVDSAAGLANPADPVDPLVNLLAP